MKAVYPIILTPAERGFVVTVPDLRINTEGDDLNDAIEMARDAIGLWGITEQDAGRAIPAPRTVAPAHEANEIVSLVDIDFDAYRRATDLRAVRKNKRVYRPGFWNKLIAVVPRVLPLSVRMRFIARRWSELEKDAF